MNNKILIIGAHGHGKVVADIAKKTGYTDIMFLDDNDAIKECCGYRVIGTSKDAVRYKEHDFVVAIGNAKIRQQIQNALADEGLRIVSLIHPDAVIAENVILGEGTVVMACAVINSDSIIGKGSIINTCASVDHDCVLGNFVHVSVGSHIAGTVSIGERTWVGIGAVVSNNISICDDCMIGAGAVVIADIEKSGTYIGVPAREKK